MALQDLQAFLVERLQQFDNTLDLSSGSPVDVQVIQPILRRLGTDPFTVDIGLFIQTLINQQFPDLPTKEGDAITDLLIKVAIVLWNPVVRETTRVANAQSFLDPTILTKAEAEALGANLFAQRETGTFSRGIARIYFAQPQSINVTPANYINSSAGLHFFPTETQSIRVEEMLVNLEGTLYFFDVNVVAEAAGDQYNIDPDNLVSIANIASAVRITNKFRFRSGTPEESAVDFVGRIEQDLTERSLVTQAGVVAKVTSTFAEVTRLNVVGFNDPEMQRDIITGGGLGALLASGVAAFSEADGSNAVATRRIATTEPGIDFTALIGPTGSTGAGFLLTVVNAFLPTSLPLIRDIAIQTVVDAQTLDLKDQVLNYTATNIVWMLRKNALTLSGIPGGILFPDTPNGTVSIPNGQIHIGGATDVYVRGSAFDSASLTISDVVDDEPLLQGVDLAFSTTTTVQLLDLVLGTNYSVGDPTYLALQRAASETLSIQILDPPNAGAFRILQVIQSPGSSPILTISPAITVVVGSYRWHISETLFVDLLEPKQTKVAGSDLRTVQGTNVVDTMSAVDFADFGVGPNDILRITTGALIVGDYVVQQVLTPFFTKLQVDRVLPATVNGAKYSVFRPNATGGISTPLVRIDSIDLLDTSGQPVGAKIPYANPIDAQSNSFANAAHGIKADVTDGRLGLMTSSFGAPGAPVNGLTLQITWNGPPLVSFTVTFTGGLNIPIATLVSQINAAVAAATSGQITRLAVVLDAGRRFGLLPVAPGVRVPAGGGTAMTTLFGFNDKDITVTDINSDEVFQTGGWAALRPAIDPVFDVAQVLDGTQLGFYAGLTVPNLPFNNTKYDPLRSAQAFNPEVTRHVQVGARSIGTARVYFLDPTSFEVDANSTFTLTASDGSQLVFLPDPTNDYQRIPPRPSGVKPLDGRTGGALAVSTFESLSTDFIAAGIQPGDLLNIDFVPLTGSVALADPVTNLNAKTFILSIGGGADKTIIFIHDSSAIASTDVTRQGVVDQINKSVGQVICSLDGTNHLQFNPTTSLIVRGSSLASSATPLLGFSAVTGVDQSNDSPDKGTYTIALVGPGGNPNRVTVTSSFFTGVTNTPGQQFSVLRVGLQRISATEMSSNLGTAGLYFFDVELISKGTGDQYNLSNGLQMVVAGFRSDGYYLTTDDPDLTFSTVERPKLHLSRSILEVGVTDAAANATQLAGQNIQINYDRSSLVGNVDNFIRSDTERVINESPLGRHLIPYFVRMSVTYTGGSKTDILLADTQTFIQDLLPTDSLEVSDIDHLASIRNARSVDHPIDLIAVIHNVDRTITVERSQDKINTGRLAAFIPDVLLFTRKIA